MSLIDKQTTYKVLSDYYHHSTDIQHKALREALDRVPSVETAADTISRQAAIDAIVDCTNCKTTDELRAYVTKHTLDNGWTGGIVDALDAVEGLPSAQPEIIYCKDCIYYDPPHIVDHGERREYKDMPNDAFDELGTGFVTVNYGINVGGRCTRDYNAGYSEDKRVFIGEDNYCGRAKRWEDG